MPVVQINGKVPWKCFRSNSGSWIAVCDLLKLTIEAETWALLMEDIGASMNVFFENLFDSDQLDQFLRKRGWKPAGTLPSRSKSMYFDIPFLPSMVNDKKARQKMLRSLIRTALFKDGWRKFEFQPASPRLPRRRKTKDKAFISHS